MIRTPHLRLLALLQSKGYNVRSTTYGEDNFDDNIFKILEENITNIKGMDNCSRYRDIISDPNNLFIERVEEAGAVSGGVITLHNGTKLHADYYGDFIKILNVNYGVHEPSEERAFSKVLRVLRDEPVMVELGSYWAMYSIWFSRVKRNSKAFCIEPDINNLNLGINNFKLNNLQADFTQGIITENGINLLNYFNKKNVTYIDILHSDIQGSELYMLYSIRSYLVELKIRYLFISTHSNYVHYSCIEFLSSVGYKILCSCDYDNESFQYDGFILACPENINEITPFAVGNRSRTPLTTDFIF
jgi:hypothetical protein